MSKQIVALQAVVERAAKDFPGAFAGSARQGRRRVLAALQDEQIWSSANAKVSAAIERIDKVRDEASQLDGAGGLLGKLRHNVNGRSTYAEGVCDATLFLAAELAKGEPSTRLFDMIDVLRAGAMS
ncbi:4-hydroxy-tetrahydrodipicolinate reductase [Aureococcus anophagefferens]|nr:4-hydroxy-tetrahydrodipicolinate reductase [Aureococcus anophagefferens]